MNVQRSAGYVDRIKTALDAGAHVKDEAKVQELMAALSSEFPELAMSQLPSAIIAKCHLGEPYEVHSLDFALSIIAHYKRGEPMPAIMERARALAQHPSYAFVEVYANELRPVAHDGRVTTI